MKKPCANCPFRSDQPFPLHEDRSREIAEALLNDQMFHCHKTVDYSSDTPCTRDASPCIGAATFLESVGPGGMRCNVMFRLAIMAGMIPFPLEHDVPVYKTVDAFIEGTNF